MDYIYYVSQLIYLWQCYIYSSCIIKTLEGITHENYIFLLISKRTGRKIS